MNIELVNEIRSLVEEYINEVSDELVDKVAKKRMEHFDNTVDKGLAVIRNPESTEEDKERIAHDKALTKLKKNKELIRKRNESLPKKIEKFRQKLLNRGYGNLKKAKEEHDNALINQGLRNKLEKSLKVSESCLSNLITLIEGELIDFQKKRKEKVLDRNAYKMADILRSGKLKVTKTGQLMGDPEAMKQVKDIEKENKEVGLGRKVGLN